MRPRSGRAIAIRVLFVFDPWSQAVLLVAGNKAGNWSVWYKEAIPLAATFNTVNKLALGIADTYALSSVAEVIGRGVPTVVVPAVNTALAARRPFRQSIESLRAEGVRVLFGPEDDWEPLPPGRNDPRLFPWLRALDLVEEAFGLTTVD